MAPMRTTDDDFILFAERRRERAQNELQDASPEKQALLRELIAAVAPFADQPKRRRKRTTPPMPIEERGVLTRQQRDATIRGWLELPSRALHFVE